MGFGSIVRACVEYGSRVVVSPGAILFLRYSTYLTLLASMISAVMRTGALMPTPWSLGGVKPTGALDQVLGAPAGRLCGGDWYGKVCGDGSVRLDSHANSTNRSEASNTSTRSVRTHALVEREARDRVDVHAAAEDAERPGDGQQEDGGPRERAHAEQLVLDRATTDTWCACQIVAPPPTAAASQPLLQPAARSALSAAHNRTHTHTHGRIVLATRQRPKTAAAGGERSKPAALHPLQQMLPGTTQVTWPAACPPAGLAPATGIAPTDNPGSNNIP